MNNMIVGSTIHAFMEQYPQLDPCGLYCSITGRLCGHVPTDEIEELIDSMQGDPDERADDLAMRILASSRPSLRWNRLRVNNVEEMRKRYPAETLAYMRNKGRGVPINDDFFAEMLARIERLAEFRAMSKEDLQKAYYDHYMEVEQAEESKAREQTALANWLKHGDPLAQQARHDVILMRIEAESERLRERRARGKSTGSLSESTIKRHEHAKKVTMAGAVLDKLFAEPFDSEPDTTPKEPAKPAFRIKFGG